MVLQDALQFIGVNSSLFEKLKDSCMVFRTPCLQRNGDQVLCGHDPCWNAFDVNLNSFSYCFFHECVARDQELHGPSTDDYILSINGTPERRQVLVDGREAYKRTLRFFRKHCKDIDIQ